MQVVQDTLRGAAPDVDEEVVEYLASVAEESIKDGAPLYEAIGDFLVSYDVVEDEDSAERLCAKLDEAFNSLRPTQREEKPSVLESAVVIGDTEHQYRADKEKLSRRDQVITLSTTAVSKERPRLQGSKREFKQDERAIVTVRAVGTGSKNVNVSDVSVQPLDGGTELLLGAQLKLVNGRRYGLVGRNGVGKTTLLKAISGGKVKGFPRHISVVHVLQESPSSSKTPLETLLDSDTERSELMQEEKELLSKQDDSDRLIEIHQRLAEIGAWDSEARASVILAGLQFTDTMIQSTPVSALSGGWRMRVALATALFLQPNLLLLDEPSNYLDFPAVLWLENYLLSYQGILLVVSHDKFFLNNVSTDIVLFMGKQLTYYRGNYHDFEKQRAEQLRHHEKAKLSNQRKRDHMQKFVDRFRASANRAASAQSRIKSIKKLENSFDALFDPSLDTDDPLMKFEFPNPEKLDGPLISVDDVSFRYSSDSPLLLRNLSLRVFRDSRIGILGVNGAGKSTLLKLMNMQLEPNKGLVTQDRRLRIAMFAQHHVDQLDLAYSAMEHLQDTFPEVSDLQLRNHLGRFGLSGDLAVRPIGKLSGGQKSRVGFATATFNNPHLLILDEPSSHADLETVEALIQAIQVFDGGVISVSHDQYYLMNAASEYWSVQDGTIHTFYSFEEAKAFSFR